MFTEGVWRERERLEVRGQLGGGAETLGTEQAVRAWSTTASWGRRRPCGDVPACDDRLDGERVKKSDRKMVTPLPPVSTLPLLLGNRIPNFYVDT